MMGFGCVRASETVAGPPEGVPGCEIHLRVRACFGTRMSFRGIRSQVRARHGKASIAPRHTMQKHLARAEPHAPHPKMLSSVFRQMWVPPLVLGDSSFIPC